MGTERKTKIVVGVTGSIASFKAAALVSRLVQENYAVTVILTGCASKMITPATFQALTDGPVISDLFDSLGDAYMAHLTATDEADLLVVAPATANFIGKCASGIADDALSTAMLACTAPVVLAPAMNPKMWGHPIVQRNVKALKDLGYSFVGPVEGRLAEGVVGVGRMAEPDEIFATLERMRTDSNR